MSRPGEKPDWPDRKVRVIFGAMLESEKLSLSKDYHRGLVVVKAGDTVERLAPHHAHVLADGYEDTIRNRGEWGSLQTKQAVKLLHEYADDVEPYHDDAVE